MKWHEVVIPSEFSFKMIQYIFRIKVLSKDTPSFQRRDWLKNERGNAVEMRCSMSNTKYGECEWDGLWSVKWMSWTMVHEMSRWTLVYEMNEMKVTRQICNIPLLKYMKNEKQFYIFFPSPAIVLSTYCLWNTKVTKIISNHISSVRRFVK